MIPSRKWQTIKPLFLAALEFLSPAPKRTATDPNRIEYEFAAECFLDFGELILLMVQKSGEHQLILGKYPIIYRVLYIPGGCWGFLNHQQDIKGSCGCHLSGYTSCFFRNPNQYNHLFFKVVQICPLPMNSQKKWRKFGQTKPVSDGSDYKSCLRSPRLCVNLLLPESRLWKAGWDEHTGKHENTAAFF